jgi:hypothetical protein
LSAALLARVASGHWNTLYYATAAQRDDRALMTAAVHKSWRAFYFASDALKADEAMVKGACLHSAQHPAPSAAVVVVVSV